MMATDWRALHQRLRDDILGYTVFAATRDGAFRRADTGDLDRKDIEGLAIAWLSDGGMSSQEKAEELLERLSRHRDVAAHLLFGRDPKLPLVGYHVNVRERQASDDDHVLYNGVLVRSGWPKRIEEAQAMPEYVLNGRAYPRIRYGDEGDLAGPVPEPCHDCAVLRGQYHVGGLCDMEECPRCHEQFIGCDCRARSPHVAIVAAVVAVLLVAALAYTLAR